MIYSSALHLNTRYAKNSSTEHYYKYLRSAQYVLISYIVNGESLLPIRL
jgi:hypothetical protein